MEEAAKVECPYCGERCEVALDVGVAHQCFVTDCEVCCRPFEVCVCCEGSVILSVEARGA